MNTEIKDPFFSDILLATDFSVRSDRALKRACLLARQFGAHLTVVHVLDDDQPARLMKAARSEAETLLAQTARDVEEHDGVQCDVTLALGEAFFGIIDTAAQRDAGLIVIGPHRRRILKDVFVGTTAERTIRESPVPVLMANGLPGGPHRSVMVATDLSDCSAAALRIAQAFADGGTAALTALHVFDPQAKALIGRAALGPDAVDAYVAEERTVAEADIRTFIAAAGCTPDNLLLREDLRGAAPEIQAGAKECAADLVVMGTNGRSGFAKLLLGSVAEQVLRAAPYDVLAVPVAEGAEAE